MISCFHDFLFVFGLEQFYYEVGLSCLDFFELLEYFY